MATQIPDNVYKVGKRIERNGHYGTIKYVGPLKEGDSENLLGIDWDNEEHGEHNGTVNGVSYFTTRLPKSGSLITTENVNIGQRINTSIIAKYGHVENEDLKKKNKEELLEFQENINAPFLNLVGFEEVAEKQRDFPSLKNVNVRLQNVSSVENLLSVCPNIREIDVSKNLLSSWDDIFNICSQLKHLFWLNVSENLLSIPDNMEKQSFPSITVLVCGFMELTFEDVNKISAVFPNVEELRVPYNKITHLTVPLDHHFKSLKYLDLEGNNIRHWKEIMKLSAIENLDRLSIDNIKLESIIFEENEFPVKYFKNLVTLNISDNLISEWRSVAELNKLEKLSHLRFTKNPILETENNSMREQIIVAKIKTLKSLNGIDLRSDERRGAEYDYVKKYALQFMKIDNPVDKEQFLLEHNRFLELVEMCGMPDEAELIVKPNIIDSSLVNVVLKYQSTEKKKSLPQNIHIQKLTLLIKKMFKLKDDPTLIVNSSLQPGIKVELSDEFKDLHFYSVQDGDTIIVQTDE